MATAGVAAELPKCDAMLVNKLPEEINVMKIKDDKVEKVVFFSGDCIEHLVYLCLFLQVRYDIKMHLIIL